jgi:lipoprotein Spr
LVKRFTVLFAFGISMASCRTMRPLKSRGAGDNSAVAAKVPSNAPLPPSKRVYKDIHRSSRGNSRAFESKNPQLFTGNIEASNWLHFKYALLMDVPVEAMSNLPLLNYMNDWYGTPYRYGGESRHGIDCSAFVAGLLATVFGQSIPRTAREQYDNSERIEKEELSEGDLVFFNTRGGISHVGVYLLNNKFVHASTSNGVMISDLDDSYFESRYVGAGRVR